MMKDDGMVWFGLDGFDWLFGWLVGFSAGEGG